MSVCKQCKKKGAEYTCAKCPSAFYCGVECQRNAWGNTHKYICMGAPIDISALPREKIGDIILELFVIGVDVDVALDLLTELRLLAGQGDDKRLTVKTLVGGSYAILSALHDVSFYRKLLAEFNGRKQPTKLDAWLSALGTGVDSVSKGSI